MRGIFYLPVLLMILTVAGCHQPQSFEQNKDNGLTPCPAAFTTSGDFTRIVIVRLKYGTDVLEGLNDSIKKEKIKNAVILNGVGSLTRYHTHVVSNTTFPTTHAYVDKDAPVDLLNINGYIIDGRVHAHITVSDDKQAIGGHLEDNTRVFTFAIITIGVLDDKVSLQRFDYNRWR